MDKIKLGISKCLLGENVRYDGRHKLDDYLKNTFARSVEWVGVCPEVECGLSVPREAMRLTGTAEAPKLVTRYSGIDHTDRMIEWAKIRLEQLEKEDLAGFVFKNGSPSCGLKEVLSEKRTGVFAKEFIEHFKLMPVEDEVSLRDNGTMKSFKEKIFTLKKIGLYLHIPFCKEKCLYCDFYSAKYSENQANLYISVILKQLQGLGQGFSSIYIGGGTPSILSLDLLDKLLSGLKKIIQPDMEFTIEVNPESVDSEKLKLFLDKGVNRISIGVQSFDDKKLKALGRIHNAKEAIKAIELSKKTGFKNVSIDMIFGVDGEDLKAWQVELEKAIGCDCQHMSCYSLSYEKDTPLFRMREKNDITPLGDETMADMYAHTIAFLPKMGFEHYEISNFARPDFECRHNLNYWDNLSYIGLGPSAVSYINGARSENIKDIKEYISRCEKGIDTFGFKEELTPIKRAKETASLKIRTRKGIDLDWFKVETGFDFKKIEKEALESLTGQGLVEYNKKDVRLTDKGFLFADTVSSTLL